MIALLTSHGQQLLHIPGRTAHPASRGYRGDGKTDAKDAHVIADQARMRRALQTLQGWDEIAVDLKRLTPAATISPLTAPAPSVGCEPAACDPCVTGARDEE